MVINWTNPAIQNLKDFKENTQMLNPDKYILNLVENVDLLTEQPKMGKIYLYTEGYIVRQLIHEQHRIFYYINENIIHIVAVVHHKQDIKKKINFIKDYFKNK